MTTERNTTNHWFSKKILPLAIATFIAVPAFAENRQQQNESSNQPNANFNEMDTDGDSQLVWHEIHVVMDPRILAANLDQEQIFSQYDDDSDGALNQEEFDQFLGDLEQREIASAGQETESAGDAYEDQAGRSNEDAQVTTDTQHGADQSTVRPESRYGEDNTVSSEPTEQQAQRNQTMPSDSDMSTRADSQSRSLDQDRNMRETGDTSLSQQQQSGDYERERPNQTQGQIGDQGSPSQTTGLSGTSETGDSQRQATEGQAQDLRNAPIESLQNKTVRNSAGEEIGEVKNVVVNPERGEIGFLVTSGGVMGIGKKQMFAPAEELSLSEDDIVWQTDRNRSELRESAKYRAEEFVEVSDQYDTIDQLRRAGLSAL